MKSTLGKACLWVAIAVAFVLAVMGVMRFTKKTQPRDASSEKLSGIALLVSANFTMLLGHVLCSVL